MQQAGFPVARQAVSISAKSSGPTVSQLSQENLSIHADRHATYSESELAEAETGITHCCLTKQNHAAPATRLAALTYMLSLPFDADGNNQLHTSMLHIPAGCLHRMPALVAITNNLNSKVAL